MAAIGAYALWFISALDQATRPSDELRVQLDDVFVDTSLNEPFYLVLLGSDSREGSETSKREAQSGDQERSDVIMLVRIDAPNRLVTLVSVPRDTPYTLEDGTVVKINETYNQGGTAETIKAVSKVTGEPISHYAEVHLSGLENVVDSLGGVDVYVSRDLKVKDALTGEKVTLSKGQQTLNGQQAQAFARARHAYDDNENGGDNSRQSNVRTLLTAIVNKVLDRPFYELQGTILNLAQYVETDLKATDLISLGLSFAGGKITVYSCSGPSAGAVSEENGGIWLCYPNPKGWTELMCQVDAGQEPGDIDYKATQQTF